MSMAYPLLFIAGGRLRKAGLLSAMPSCGCHRGKALFCDADEDEDDELSEEGVDGEEEYP